MTTANNLRNSDLRNIAGRHAVDTNGAKLGKVGQVYVDDRTSRPMWVTIKTGMFGMKESFAPLYGCRSDGDNLRLAVTKDMVKDAPSIEADATVEGDENEALYNYYQGYFSASAQNPAAQYEGRDSAGGAGTDWAGRARLRKYVVTETVPVSHEEQIDGSGTNR